MYVLEDAYRDEPIAVCATREIAEWKAKEEDLIEPTITKCEFINSITLDYENTKKELLT